MLIELNPEFKKALIRWRQRFKYPKTKLEDENFKNLKIHYKISPETNHALIKQLNQKLTDNKRRYAIGFILLAILVFIK